MRETIKKIHFWLSIPAGIVIILMCLTGAILVFQEEALRAIHPERYKVKVRSIRLTLDDIVEQANASLANDTITAIQVFNKPERTCIATLSSGQRTHAYLDPYTGEIAGYYNYRKGFFSDVTRLHRWLMFNNNKTGKVITGASAIFFVFILISGIVVWWPRKNAFKKSFFKVKWNSSHMRRLFDLHRTLGIYVAVVLLLLCLTGLMWSFDWYRQGVASVFNIENSTGGHGGNRRGDYVHVSGRNGMNEKRTVRNKDWWQQAFDTAKDCMPDYKSIRIAINGTVTILPDRAPHPRATDTYRFSPNDNKLEPVSLYGEKRDNNYMMTWTYALHTGTWGGIWSKVIMFLSCLIGASLPVTGYMLWLKSAKTGHSSNQVKHTS